MIKTLQARAVPPAHPGTEQKILDAARQVFLSRGTAGARMHEIAKEAGVNQALLHYYFRSKGALAEAVFSQAAAQLFAPVARVLASELSLDEKVRHVVEIELETLAQNPQLPAYIIGEITQSPDRAVQLLDQVDRLKGSGALDQMMAKLQAQIDAAVALGAMRPLPAREFLTNLLALCIFPFATRPMLQAILSLDDLPFEAFLEERKTNIPVFFLAALR